MDAVVADRCRRAVATLRAGYCDGVGVATLIFLTFGVEFRKTAALIGNERREPELLRWAPWNCSPAPHADGYDPAITGIRISPGGTMKGAAGGASPGFTIRFRLRLG